MKQLGLILIIFILNACTNVEADIDDKKITELIISDELIEFKKHDSTKETENVKYLNGILTPIIKNDTLIAEFTAINSGGYHYNGNIEWSQDTLTLLLFDFDTEPMLEEFAEDFHFMVKLNNKKPKLVRYKYLN